MAFNNKGYNRKNWIQTQKDKFGDNFLDRISAQEIGNNVLRIIQDISRGNFDINTSDLTYFNDPRIINSVIEYCDVKVAEFTEISNGLNILMNSNPTKNTAPTLQNVSNILIIYSHIKDVLECYRVNNDISLFIQMQQNIKNYRFYLDLNKGL